MHDVRILGELAALFGAAALLVLVLHRLRLPPIAGFLLAGALAGPRALGLIGESAEVAQLAELGVIALLFGIGLELPVERLRRLGRTLLVGGGSQLTATMALAALAARAYGLPLGQALVVGAVVAVSSTAIVLRSLQETGQVESPPGRSILAILIFQDLCVIPLMMLTAFLASDGAAADLDVLLPQLGRALGVILAVFLIGRPLARRGLRLVARTRQQSLFVLALIALCLGTAWFAAQAGVTLALGAFLAGVMVADTDFRHKALSDLIPFREAFASLFFLSVGMLIDPIALARDFGPTAALAAAIVLGKFTVVLALGALMRWPMRASVIVALGLAQVGEFSFLLLAEGARGGLLAADLHARLLGATVLTMLAAPFLLRDSERIAAGCERLRLLARWFARPKVDAAHQLSRLDGHVLIGGYGLTGQAVAQALQEAGVPCVVADLNPDGVARAQAAGHRAVYGDVGSPEMLHVLGAERARELVVAVNDPNATERALRAAREAAPNLHVIARVPFLADVAPMMAAGADEVVPMEAEAAAEMVARVLRRRGADAERVAAVVAALHERLGCAPGAGTDLNGRQARSA